MKFNEKQRKHRHADHRHSWWHSPLLGYPLAVLFTAIAFLIPMSEKSVGIEDLFIEPPFVIATLLVGWFWGIGPALLALLLEVLAIDYWLVPPLGSISFFLWPNIVSFAPFILIQLIVLGLIVVQKNYRQQLLHANQEISQHAEELAESNTRLEQADRVKDQFLSMASHELRTPVTGIQGYVQLLLHRLKKQSIQNPEWLPMYDALGKVDEQTRRLTDLVNDLLDINTLRSGKMPVHLEFCELGCLCRRVVEEQQALVGRSIDLRLPADPVTVQVDNRRFSQVVSNLVSNALKYSPKNTPILVEVSQRPGEAILAVHNESPVLTKEQQKSLFEPFYRSCEAQSPATPGWGLGLAICKEIVVLHNGRIWVESSAEKGTTFFVALPLPTSSESA
ncbi:sensor histidine kinase [Ktedonobacter racemifer]|uniref:histidine kinase n=1 Tax=Ktedonobacter racemifer DSM 44963 TaxID=485913 RepID=D6TTP8_KTERA|nr:HAMP domain-containing sensor histidine kinase [Ktedonobacter racemifer]EFH83799.1 integral membrane sensor signal transduction histidine kinase [Ktedonobacter racemifer DSM 44963]